jgi:type IV secretory pathway VirB2 component (pilin)
MTTPSNLDDPEYAAFAWRRFRRILAWMGLATAIVIAIAIAGLDHFYGPLSWIAILATIGGVGGSVMLAAALMGLAFLSSGTGHDESVNDID